MTFTVPTNALLWIAIILLLAVVAYLAWKLWAAGQGKAPPVDTASPPSASPSPAPSAPAQRRGTPPPGWAGQASSTAPPTLPRRAGTAPPASAGGNRPAASGGGPGAGNPGGAAGYGAPKPRSAKPPPVLAGNVPGYTPAASAPAARPRAHRPPAASAGGSGDGGKTSSDPEPAEPATSEMAKASRKGSRPAVQTPPYAALAKARSWAYQLQDLDIAEAAASPFDVLVIDYARDGGGDSAWKPAEVARLKARDGGPPRLVYAYLSIGEAESYRFYWQKGWINDPPAWLLSENPDWKENYAVAYWDAGWQNLLFCNPQAYVDRIAKAGFDGLYLDKADVYEDLLRREKELAKAHDLEAEMVRFLVRLSAYVRSKYPGLGLVMQNAENLLAHAEVRAAIDGAAKEELLYGQAGGARRNARGEIDYATKELQRLKREGKAVLVVEYLDDAEKAATAAQELRALGFVPYVSKADRELATLEPQEAQIA